MTSERPTIVERLEAAGVLLTTAYDAYMAELREYRAELGLGRDVRAPRVREAWIEVVEARELMAGVLAAIGDRPGFL